MKSRKRQRKGLVRKNEIIILTLFVASAVSLLAFTNSFGVLAKSLHLEKINKSITISLPFGKKKMEQTARYYSGEQVQISSSAKKDSLGKGLSHYQNWIGTVKKIKSQKDSRQKHHYSYEVTFDNGKALKYVQEKDLVKTKRSKYSKGQIVKLKSSATADLDGSSLTDYRASAGKIDHISYNHSNTTGGYKYDITFDEGGKVTNIQEKDLDKVYEVQLKSENTAAQNTEILKQAFAYAKQHSGTILSLPNGEFKIGSQTPDKDYITLTSDTEIRGDNTTLLVEGSAYWFAFATGTSASDGVKNFTMRNINIKASDLEKGNQFMIMADHGDNWKICNNSFTMVHKKGSHIFDLGSLQNSAFEGNQFTGYAPELTNVSKIDDNADLHDFYSEVIQLDAAESSGVWDGGLIKAIDPNYENYNKEKQLCNNITIANNSFVPYIDSHGKIIAYSGTIGQHSSDVGLVKIYDNVFSNSLVSRFNQNGKSEAWIFKAIHLKSNYNNAVYANSIS